MTVLASFLSHPLTVVPLIVGWVTDPPPSDNDVKAGWTAFAIFLALVAALVVLLISFTRQLRKVNAAQRAGVFGSDDADSAGEATESDAAAPR